MKLGLLLLLLLPIVYSQSETTEEPNNPNTGSGGGNDVECNKESPCTEENFECILIEEGVIANENETKKGVCIDTSEREILRVINSALGGDEWRTKWNMTSNIWHCKFPLLSCDDLYKVSELMLVNNNVAGKVPNEITKLRSLEKLHITDSPKFGGQLNAEIFVMPAIKEINFLVMDLLE
eukprot:UN31835